MPIKDPEQITSNLPSSLNCFKEVIPLGHNCISSKKINVLPSSKLILGFSKDIFLIILSTSYPLSKIVLKDSFVAKLISTKFL